VQEVNLWKKRKNTLEVHTLRRWKRL